MASTGAHRTERPLVVIVWSHDSPAEWNEAHGCRRRRVSSPRARKFSFKGEPADYFHKVISGPICSYRLFERWTPQPGLRLAKWLTIMNEKPQVVRSSEPRVGAARKAEELLGVTEIVLGYALGGRDREAELGAAEKAESSPEQAGRTAAVFSLIIAYMQRLAFREDADTKADAREAIEEKALAEEAKRKAAEELAAVAVARAVRKAPEGKPNSDAEAKERAERAEADLAQERARIQALEKQLAARADEQKLLAQERARTQALEQQLAARQHDQDLRAPAAWPANSRLASAQRNFRQYWPRALAASAILLLFLGGGAGYAVFFSPSRSPDTVASQAAAALAAATPVTAPAADESAKSSARFVEEASRRKAALEPQAEEQRLADEAAARERLQREQAAAKTAEEEAKRSAEPGEADLRMTYRDRQKLQVALTSLGFDVGRIDGTFGLRSRQMIAAWQTKNGDISTGFFTAAQKKALLSEGAPAVAKWEDEQRRAYAEEQRRLQQQQSPPPQRRSGWK